MLIVEKASLSGAPEVEGAAKGLLAAAVVPKVPALPNKALPKPVSEAAGGAPIYERSRVEPHCDREDGKQGKDLQRMDSPLQLPSSFALLLRVAWPPLRPWLVSQLHLRRILRFSLMLGMLEH
jgi:hypothetical protein